jgi:DNA-binding transcriptional regulator YhcF (GntR family)
MNQHESFLYKKIAESLRRQIASGDLRAGDKLPSVREAARRWNCTPGTVSKAYAQLSQEGLVSGQRGGGQIFIYHNSILLSLLLITFCLLSNKFPSMNP